MTDTLNQQKGNWKEQPIATILIVAITVILFLYSTHINPQLIEYWANDNEKVLKNREYHRLLTCMFLHANMAHLSGNMLLFGAMGSMIEKRIGSLWWSLIYFLSGILGAFFTNVVYLQRMEIHRSLGASIGAYGVVGLLLTLVLLHKGRYVGISTNRMIFVIAMMVFTSKGAGDIDHVAHVFGFLMGFILSFIPGIMMMKKEKYYDNQGSN